VRIGIATHVYTIIAPSVEARTRPYAFLFVLTNSATRSNHGDDAAIDDGQELSMGASISLYAASVGNLRLRRLAPFSAWLVGLRHYCVDRRFVDIGRRSRVPCKPVQAAYRGRRATSARPTARTRYLRMDATMSKTYQHSSTTKSRHEVSNHNKSSFASPETTIRNQHRQFDT
jgi:hypothetical protein